MPSHRHSSRDAPGCLADEFGCLAEQQLQHHKQKKKAFTQAASNSDTSDDDFDDTSTTCDDSVANIPPVSHQDAPGQVAEEIVKKKKYYGSSDSFMPDYESSDSIMSDGGSLNAFLSDTFSTTSHDDDFSSSSAASTESIRFPSFAQRRRSEQKLDDKEEIAAATTEPPAKAYESKSSPAQVATEATSALQAYLNKPLTTTDKVMCMQLWNKVLAFQTAFAEALVLEWRLLVEKDREPPSGASSTSYRPFQMVETNQDLLAVLLQDRLYDAESLVCAMIDGALRSLCPHTQNVAREAYRPIADTVHLALAHEDDFHLGCESVQDHFVLFARSGIPPEAWVHFLHAMEWALKTHVPYAQDDDKEDLASGEQSAILRALAQLVSAPAIVAWKDLSTFADSTLVRVALPRFWKHIDTVILSEIVGCLHERVKQCHPDLLDYLVKSDADLYSVHYNLSMPAGAILDSVSQLASDKGPFRLLMIHLGNDLLKMGLPTYAYPLLAYEMIQCLEPYFKAEETRTRDDSFPVSVCDLKNTCQRLCSHILSLVSAPMLRQEKLIAAAREFYEQVRIELGWNDQVFDTRMAQIEQEIAASGTYNQTTREIEIGARLAWRNSAKCIGRIAWNTLQVRDCRDSTKSEQIFEQVEQHLRVATAGTNIQSVMTVFQPLKPGESIGPRFWSTQCVRYAGYRDAVTGDVLGDSANAELTEYLLSKKMWTPPEPKSAFDLLPLVFKEPNQETPKIHHLSKDSVFEVFLSHPTCDAFKDLSLRWTTVPAITNFKMNLGGVIYPNIPFNGWFVSTEIVRNLMERYDVGPRIAKLFHINTQDDAFWRQAVTVELERAVLHSFRQSGFTIVDPHSVGESFCTHVRREREQFGRECPAQWSWIGGLTGPTNDTWHLETRDFVVAPQYEYTVSGDALYSSLEGIADYLESSDSSDLCSLSQPELSVPRVLILYGSETGQAENLARKLKRSLRALRPLVMSLNEAAGLAILRVQGISHILCLTSTFGDGEPPANAIEFFEKELPSSLPAVSFAVLALGSTLYPNFCKAGIDLDRKLEAAGLGRLTVGVAKADASEGADESIEEWMYNVKQIVMPLHIEQAIMRSQSSVIDQSTAVLKWRVAQASSRDAVDEQTNCLCVSNHLITNGSKSVRRIVFKVPTGQAYKTGDHIAVQPLNSPASVQRFLACFRDELLQQARISCPNPYAEDVDLVKWQANQVFDLEMMEGGVSGPADVFFQTPTTLDALLSRKVELGISKSFAKDLLRLCNDVCQEQQPKTQPVSMFLSEVAPLFEKPADIDDFIARFPTVAHFFEFFSFFSSTTANNGNPPLVALADVLFLIPRLRPRFYSISSSNKASPDELAVTVGVLNGETSQKVRFDGVCSNFLAKLSAGQDSVQLEVRTSTFRLPRALDCPIIMVSAGSGIAPMMGFLHDLSLAKESGTDVGEVHFFFGCRTEADFLYGDEINEYVNSGLVTLHLAISRPNPRSCQPKKVYVQDLIRTMASTFSKVLMHPRTAYYVCGDARMAAECREAAIEMLREHEGLRGAKAIQHVRQMGLDNRWQSDVWGEVDNSDISRQRVKISKRYATRAWRLLKSQGSFESTQAFADLQCPCSPGVAGLLAPDTKITSAGKSNLIGQMSADGPPLPPLQQQLMGAPQQRMNLLQAEKSDACLRSVKNGETFVPSYGIHV